MANAIFISYRRDDTEGEAGRLFDDLTRAFGSENVFMDVAGIRPGADFRRVIDEKVAHCGVLLSIIGPTWASITNADGKRRLEDPNDFVALEIGSALKREVPVIPVLVHSAHMPAPDQLPEALKDLAYRNSVEISHARWNSDVQLLIDALGSYVTTNPKTEQEPVHATVPVQLPAPHPAPTPPAQPVKKSKLPLILGIAAVLVIAVIVILHFAGESSSGADASSLVGTWNDPNPRAGDSLSTLTIAGSENSLTMHGTGSCQPTACDWGTQPATFDGEYATADFTPTSSSGVQRTAEVKVRLKGGGLEVNVHNTFTDANGSRENNVKVQFVPAQ